MLQKKICMLGAFAVGKTSLVQRYVRGIYSDRYLTTVGVKIDKKTLLAGGRELTLILWDLAGEDEFAPLQLSYLRGSSGLLLVADGTRRETLVTAEELAERAREALGAVPALLLLNKSDLSTDWEIDAQVEELLAERGLPSIRTSAKDGSGVEAAFQELAERLAEDTA